MLTDRQQKIYDYLYRNPESKIAWVAGSLHCSSDTADRDIRKLDKLGLVKYKTMPGFGGGMSSKAYSAVKSDVVKPSIRGWSVQLRANYSFS